jgi:RNA polymerase sigma-70 factor (ECF subfamily)
MDARTEFATLYERHAPEVHRTANAVLQDPTIAEEVVQEVFLALWRESRFDEARGPMGPYLRMLARSRALDALRRRNARDRMATRLLTHAGSLSTGAADEPVLRDADREVARAAVRRLPSDQRKAIVLTYWGDLTVQEAADAEGIPLGTAKSRVRLGLRKLAADPRLAA